MIFGKYINRYYLRSAPVLLLGLLALLTVDYIQLMIPELYRLVINGVNLGEVVIDGQTLAFTKEVLFQHICLPMIWIVLLMVVGRFLWRVCFFGSAVLVTADLRERMFAAEEDPALCAGRLYALYGLHEPVGHLERPDPPLPVRRLCDPVHILYLPREEGQCEAQLHAVV